MRGYGKWFNEKDNPDKNKTKNHGILNTSISKYGKKNLNRISSIAGIKINRNDNSKMLFLGIF
jgi:hypothetical protein